MHTAVCTGAGLEYLIKTPVVASPAYSDVVMLLHGRYSSMDEFAGLAEALDSRHYVYVLPKAPFAVTPSAASDDEAVRYTWRSPVDRDAGAIAINRLMTLAAEVAGRPGTRRMIIGGFSEGGACALRCGLSAPRLFSGMVALSAPVAKAEWARGPASSSAAGLPVFLAQGLQDDVVPPHRARGIRALLEREGHVVTYHEYPIAHAICIREIRDLRQWLHRHFPPGRADAPSAA